MIVKMNKYAWLVYHKEYDAFLERLRSFGAVHVNAFQSTKDHPVIQKLISENKRVKTQIDYLNTLLKDGEGEAPEQAGNLLTNPETEQLITKIETMRDRIAAIDVSLGALEKERAALSVWGDFKYDTLKRLQEAGYKVTFYSCAESHFDENWEKEAAVFVINTLQSIVYFIVVAPVGTPLNVNADIVRMSQKDYGQVCAEIEEEKRRKAEIEADLSAIAHSKLQSLQNLYTTIVNETAWNETLAQTARKADDKLMFVEGWIPHDQAAGMEKSLSDSDTASGYYFRKLEITDDDQVPIKLKNNKFSRLFEPITEMYSLPNYKEFDPTPLFAPFFMLFFGMCFGDGGYGIMMILLSLFLKRRVKESMKTILTLVLYFGIATLCVGTLTGSFLGVSLVDIKALSSIKDYFIKTDNVMIISLVIGFVHVLFAKCVAAWKIQVLRGFKYSVSAFGWIFIIFSIGCVFGLPMIDISLSQPVEYAFLGVAAFCGLIVLFYNTPGKNPFVNFGSGLWNTYNMVTGVVGDVLSYIRLYAIGLTGGLLGGVFNTIAIDMTSSLNPFVRWLPMLAILLIGHALNIALCTIGSLVHPLRLVFVEYFKNSEYEGGGIDYKPFKKL